MRNSKNIVMKRRIAEECTCLKHWETHTIHSDRTTCCDHCNENGVLYESLLPITKKGKCSLLPITKGKCSGQQKGKRSRAFDKDDIKQLEKI